MPDEIKPTLLQLIDKKNISSCQQNQRTTRSSSIYEKVLGNERHCYKVNRAKREKTLPDVLSKEEVKDFLTVAKENLAVLLHGIRCCTRQGFVSANC